MARHQQQPIPRGAPDFIWDNLARMGATAIRLGQLPSRLTPILRDPRIMEELQTQPGFVSNLTSISNDVRHLAEELNGIGRSHCQRTGSSRSSDDLMRALAVGEQYHAWFARFNGIVLVPTLDLIQSISGVIQKHGIDLSDFIAEIGGARAAMTAPTS